MPDPTPQPHQKPGEADEIDHTPKGKLDTRKQAGPTDPRESYSVEIQRELRAAEMLIVAAHHNLDNDQPLSDPQRAILQALGTLPETY